MKLIQLPVAFIALSLITVPIVFAQETETPTEKASPSPAEKADTKKAETEKKSETETTSPETSPSPAAKKEKTESSPAVKASPTEAAVAKPAMKGSAEAQLKDIEKRWEGAFLSHDVKVVEEILADRYVLTNEKGKVLNRSGALKEFKKNTDTFEKVANSNVVVHMISKDAAVVTGMTHEVGKDKSGKKFDRTFRWTDTFVNRNGKWEAVATQVNLVAQK